jgi:nicotinate phosphoribosyltransferase
LPPEAQWEDLLAPVFRKGKLVHEQPPLSAIRARVQEQLKGFHSGIKRFLHPHEYPVGLAPGLHDLRTRLILAARGEDLAK